MMFGCAPENAPKYIFLFLVCTKNTQRGERGASVGVKQKPTIIFGISSNHIKITKPTQSQSRSVIKYKKIKIELWLSGARVAVAGLWHGGGGCWAGMLY
jgi:hypothetical protein